MDGLKKYAAGYIAVLICLLTISFLNFIAHKKPSLVDRIGISLQSNAKDVSLRDFVNFDWTEVCIFRQHSSFPSSAYDAYIEYMKKAGENSKLLSRRNYGIIFLFKTSHGFEQEGFGRAYTKIQGKSWYLYANDDGKQSNHTTTCLKGNVTMRKYPGDLIILSGQKKDN